MGTVDPLPHPLSLDLSRWSQNEKCLDDRVDGDDDDDEGAEVEVDEDALDYCIDLTLRCFQGWFHNLSKYFLLNMKSY